jgi:hypothetical protein
MRGQKSGLLLSHPSAVELKGSVHADLNYFRSEKRLGAV